MSHKIEWLDAPEVHDYEAAFDYLELHLTSEQAAQGADQLREAPVVKKKAKDILRAANLQPLPRTDRHVRKDIEKIEDGKPLSPVLLVRAYPLIIADGYHRVCAVYDYDYDVEVPCQIR